ncbi:hypothetical protein BLA6860_01856 [Burkholderia lata]|nr:hypothetical protein BLA6860_01856 [Burkholderia lata]
MPAPDPHSETTCTAYARMSYAGNQGGTNPSRLRPISRTLAVSVVMKFLPKPNSTSWHGLVSGAHLYEARGTI